MLFGNFMKAELNNSRKYLLKRLLWYLTGFALFFAPLALLQKILAGVFKVPGKENIHGACFRMTVQDLFSGKIKGFAQILTTSGIIVSMALIAAFFFGPVFCGRFCIAGAIPEYISRIIPDKIKINWQKHINPAPVRYGLLAGFLAGPALGISLACSYCNFSLVERMILGVSLWNIGVLGSTSIITMFIWIILLGAFAKGGRGYCTYLCPIGAVQNIFYAIGSRFQFTYKIKYDRSKCVSCRKCVKDCPTGALQMNEEELRYNIHTCITCHQCEKVCPKAAITYGVGISDWNTHYLGKYLEDALKKA